MDSSSAGILDDGRKVTVALCLQILDDELRAIKERIGPERYAAGRFCEARDLFTQVATDDEFVDFHTLPGYAYVA